MNDLEQALSIIESLASQVGCLAILLPTNDVRRTSEDLATAAMNYVNSIRYKHRPTTPEVVLLVNRLYSGVDLCTRGSGGLGGHLHIVVDDSNVQDHHVQYCLDEARADKCATCTVIAEKLRAMTKTQRLRVSHDHS